MTQNDLTVLVVGAGANADFRLKEKKEDKDKKKAEEEKIAMPTGEQLVEKIADWEGQVLPNLYWGFIRRKAEKYEIDHFKVTDAVIKSGKEQKDEKFNLRSVIHQIFDITGQAESFLSQIGFNGHSSSNPPYDIKFSDDYYFRGEVVNRLKADNDFGLFYKISEIVKHYQPFSIDEMLDSIKVGKIDVGKWTGKTENDEVERGELIRAGKELIALFLLQSEDKKVFDYDSLCWYRHLRNAIITCGKNKKEIEEKLKNFVIISFNYDRSLDYFLRTRVSEFYDKIRVIYPYGSLAGDEKHVRDGRWDGETKDYQELLYGAAKGENSFQQRWENFQKAKGLAADLKVIGELEEDDKGRKKIEEMQECIKIFGAAYFLGFAFHKENCRIMGMDKDFLKKCNQFKADLSDNKTRVFFTNFGESMKTKNSFNLFFGPNVNRSPFSQSSSKGAYDALAHDFDFNL